MEDLGFVIAAAGLLSMAAQVVWQRSPLRGALALIAALCFQAGLYVLLSAPFVAAMQVLVYAGAIMVLFVFVIMLLNLGPDEAGRLRQVTLSKVVGSVAAVALVGRLVAAACAQKGVGAPGRGLPNGSVRHVGELMLTDYLVGFEAVSVVLLVAVVGSVVLGFRRLS